MSATVRFKRWYLVHKWSSLVCTLFLLLLCVTGLPLIFHDEIEHLTGASIEAPAMPASTPRASLDRITQAALASRPTDVIQYLVWELGEADTVLAVMAPRPDTRPDDTQTVVVDARTASVLGQPAFTGSVMFILLKLHTDMFAGLPGKLFLGAMGLLFLVSIVSGIFVYGPLMKKLAFGTVRAQKSRRIKWLDLHNLLGIATLAWAFVVGLTGVISTLADLSVAAWRTDQMASMLAGATPGPLPSRLASVQRAVYSARELRPAMTPSFVAFPGTPFSSPHHYTVFLRGETVLTSRLLQPVLVDAVTGAVTDSRRPPWHMTAMLLSQPLHFGDYGGMPMKIIWAILDVIAIVVLGSGVYLWWVRRKRGSERIASVRQGPASPAELR